MNLVKYSCGSTGLDIPNSSQALVLRSVESKHVAYFRDMSGKTREPLSSEESAEVLHALQLLIRDGYKFRQIRHLLSP